MDNNGLLGKLIVGTVINFIVLYILEQVDNRLAMLYLFAVILLIMLSFKDQIFPSLNLLIGTVKGSVS